MGLPVGAVFLFLEMRKLGILPEKSKIKRLFMCVQDVIFSFSHNWQISSIFIMI